MQIGLIGLGVMGRNLALNLRDAGYRPVVWDPWPEARDWRAPEIAPAASLEDLIAALAPPRAILLMIKAGAPVTELCVQLKALLEAGDCVLDGGNSFYRDSDARERLLGTAGLGFLGLGISGGAEGARHGPAMMAGGDATTWARLAPPLQAIAAKADGAVCADYFGGGGAGHFVKMVHNGIEYAVMQAIAEACALLAPGHSPAAVGALLTRWARGPLAGYLLEITAEILGTRDGPTERPILEVISDVAGHKGTGGWCVAAGLDYGVPIPAIAEAVALRQLSAQSDLRQAMGAVEEPTETTGAATASAADVEDALGATIIVALSQGLQLIDAASRENGWQASPQAAAGVWRQGSILRMALLERVTEGSSAADLLRDDVAIRLKGWRRAAATGLSGGLPLPVMTASLAYWNGLTTARLPTAMIQAQRDRFGAHGFARTDRPGTHHGPWGGEAS